MTNQPTTYYNKIARQYDQSRFANTYGQYINQQERNLMNRLMKNTNKQNSLDIGCGTGRLLDFADYGIDASAEMLNIAREKYPNKHLYNESAVATHFEDRRFEQIFSFHVFMHLDIDTIKNIINEAYRLLKPGGRLIFDIPSKKRRQLINYTAQNWHGATALGFKDVIQLTQSKWQLLSYHGLLFFPIHRCPTQFRHQLINVDAFFSRSPLKEYSSYLVFVLEKK